ncbi:phage protein [Escherichia phage L27]|uniref:Phage protein n=1 Tax=Escherichia phage L27 TaxID=2562890 RepID=A0A455XIY6_9CAUD|nr:phage protein [Escherichia phage L27]
MFIFESPSLRTLFSREVIASPLMSNLLVLIADCKQFFKFIYKESFKLIPFR